MKLTREQVQALVNAAVTILIIILSLAGYTVTVLDPAKTIIIENGRFIAAQVEELQAKVDQLAAMPQPFMAGGITHYTGLALPAATTQTVTNGSTIDVSGASYFPITASAAAGTSSITGCVNGQLVVLENIGSYTITITDTGTLKLAGNAALGQYDTLTLICDGTNLIELKRSDN